jgi:hypothetical protein
MNEKRICCYCDKKLLDDDGILCGEDGKFICAYCADQVTIYNIIPKILGEYTKPEECKFAFKFYKNDAPKHKYYELNVKKITKIKYDKY